ncbi:MAG TPA: heat shock protein HspQ [Rhodospirillales bacterium]|nr:heat shock protein HspQ [Rhodospirillales bacterium]
MNETEAKFAIGQLVHHKMFDYRGVVIDVDPGFRGSEDWYNRMAKSRPPKERPWYHVLVDGQVHRTYVAERNLEPDETGAPIDHADIDAYFKSLGGDGYIPRRRDS